MPSVQIWETPPLTNSSIPVTKLESLDARNRAAVAISSGRPIVPRGIKATKASTASFGIELFVSGGVSQIDRRGHGNNSSFGRSGTSAWRS